MTDTDRLSTLTKQYHELQATTDAVRWLQLKALTGSESLAADLYRERYPRSTYLQKAAVPPVTIGGGGDALLPPSVDPIIALVQRLTLPERLGLRKVPFNTPVPVQSALGTYAWVLQNVPKPVSRIDFAPVTTKPAKISGIVPLSRELVRLAPGAESAMSAALVGGAVQFQDAQLLDPTVTELDPGRPASLTNGVVPVVASGTTLAEKVDELIAALYANRPETQKPAIIATPQIAQGLARTAGTATGAGRFGIVPVYASAAAADLVIALDAAAVIYSDDGGSVDTSDEATVMLDDAPSGASPFTSFWQSNHIGFRIERMLWWQKVAANAVQTLAVS